MSCCNITIPSGPRGWSPVLAIVEDGERRVLQLTDWTGGEGAKPGFIDYYLGETGFVLAIEDGTNIRGAEGTGADGQGIAAVSRTSGTGAPGTIDTYTLWADAIGGIAIGTFDVYNGTDGQDGTNGTGSGVVISVVAGAGIAVDSSDPANPIVSATGGGGGEANTNSNAGGDVGLVNTPIGVDTPIKGLTAGTNITLTPSGTDVTINAPNLSVNVEPSYTTLNIGPSPIGGTIKYRKYGHMVTITIELTNTSGGTISPGVAGGTLPAGYRPPIQLVMDGYTGNLYSTLETNGNITTPGAIPTGGTLYETISYIVDTAL
jgi:hypothetical protein